MGIALVAAACFPSLDSLVGATDAGVPADASPVPDAPVIQRDADVPILDAGVDAFEAGPFCKTNVPANTFCSDFDLNDLTVFSNVQEFFGGTVVIDNGDASLSPPGSLVTTIPSHPVADAGAFSQAYAHYRTSPAQSSVAEVSFAFRIDKASADRSSSLVVLQFVGPDRNFEARLSIDADRTLFISQLDTKTQAYSEPFRTPKAFPVGEWHRIRYRVELLAANSGRADLDLDGVPQVTAAAITPAITSGNLRVSVGLPFARAPNDSWTTRIDDLLVFPK